MQIRELPQTAPESALSYDICIVGSGPAAFAIASQFVHTRHSVCVLESGRTSREDDFTASLNEIESVGAPRVMNQRLVRNRVLGGSSHTWSGRCTSFDAFDYEQRPWIPNSGWPITAAEMIPFLHRAEECLGLVATSYGAELLSPLGLTSRFDAQDGTELRSVFWQFSRRSALNGDYVRFGSRFARLRAPNMRIVTDATVVEVVTNASGTRVEELVACSSMRERRRIKSRLFVLCAGAIENARLLLTSNRIEPFGVGNRNGLVGRFLMDHPRAIVGTFSQEQVPDIQSEFGLFNARKQAKFQRGLSLSFEVQRREQLLNCAAWTTQHVAEDDAWRALRSIGRSNGSSRLKLSKTVLRHADQIVDGLWRKVFLGQPLPRRMKELNLDVMIEQVPSADSRVILSKRTDAHGVPLSVIDWKIGTAERQTAIRLAQAVYAALLKEGLPVPKLVDWVRENRPEDAVFSDPAHPMGTTRMADSPNSGVVDKSCQVFAVDNLYVCGSSVFPTGGHANPTFMIVALALRLAEALKERVA